MFEREKPSDESRANTLVPSPPRLFMAAFACHPDDSMEERNGWSRALQAAEKFHVTVACGPDVNSDYLNSRVPEHLKERVRFFTIDAGVAANYCLHKELFFYLGYRAWHAKVYQFAKKLHRESPFAITHMVTVCGFREPGFLWKLDCPFVWGPIGGTSNFPLAYWSVVDPLGGLYEAARNVLNSTQLRFSGRVRAAARRAAVVVAANRSTQRDLEKHLGVQMKLELEAGLDYKVGSPKQITSPDRPLRILWVGRLRPWKGLPLLLKALGQQANKQAFELRVVGDGASKSSWIKIAKQLKIDDRITWEARPAYRASMHHYEWADVFAFTSLRDTSGTGLLESLAAGVPIIGLDHQGAADIMTEDCGIRIPVTTPQESSAEFARVIEQLTQNRKRLASLSEGAIDRARKFTWSDREQIIESGYQTGIRKPVVTIIDVPNPACPKTVSKCSAVELSSRTY